MTSLMIYAYHLSQRPRQFKTILRVSRIFSRALFTTTARPRQRFSSFCITSKMRYVPLRTRPWPNSRKIRVIQMMERLPLKQAKCSFSHQYTLVLISKCAQTCTTLSQSCTESDVETCFSRSHTAFCGRRKTIHCCNVKHLLAVQTFLRVCFESNNVCGWRLW